MPSCVLSLQPNLPDEDNTHRLVLRVGVSPTNRRAFIDFLPGLPALQKYTCIFPLKQAHSLDMALACVQTLSIDANVNSMSGLF